MPAGQSIAGIVGMLSAGCAELDHCLYSMMLQWLFLLCMHCAALQVSPASVSC
jgi:hypothetical protein